MTRAQAALLTAGVLIVVGLWRGLHGSGEIGADLLFGWIPFLNRVLPGVRMRWDGVAAFTAALLCVAVIAHLFLRWLCRELAPAKSLRHAGWRCRWTLVLVALIVVLFTAGISMVGATHQTAWLATSPAPLFGKSVLDRSFSSRNNLRQLNLALKNSSDTHGFPVLDRRQLDEHPVSWVVPILPFLSYRKPELDLSRPWNDPVNAAGFQRLVPELINPELRNPPLRDVNGFGLNHYAGNSAVFEMRDPGETEDFPFGQANLLLIGEVRSEFVAWGAPDNSRDPALGIHKPGGFGGASHDGAQFLMADGSVRLISTTVDPTVLRSLSRPTSTH
jgi:hypothetical protein